SCSWPTARSSSRRRPTRSSTLRRATAPATSCRRCCRTDTHHPSRRAADTGARRQPPHSSPVPEGAHMRLRRTTVAVFAAALVLSACGDGDDTATDVEDSPSFAAGSTMAKLADAGKMTIGTKFDQPGFGFKGLEDAPEGFDVEIAKIIAAKLGIQPDQITWTETVSAVREEVIEQGKVDMVVATYTINDKRKQRVTFAGPYYTAGQQIMVKSDNTAITGPDSFKANPTSKVCSATGSPPPGENQQDP